MFDRAIMLTALCLAALCVAAAILGGMTGNLPAGKLVNSGSALLGLASIFQLKMSGLFDQLIHGYMDEDKYPYGPPSHFTRKMFAVDNPDQPVRSAVRVRLYHSVTTGAQFGVASLLLALVGAWL